MSVLKITGKNTPTPPLPLPFFRAYEEILADCFAVVNTLTEAIGEVYVVSHSHLLLVLPWKIMREINESFVFWNQEL